MSVSRILSRVSKLTFAQSRATLSLSLSQQKHNSFILSNQFHSLRDLPNKFFTVQVSPLNSLHASVLQCCGFSSSASPEPTVEDNGASTDAKSKKSNGDTQVPHETAESSSRKTGTPEQTESDSDEELSKDDLVKLVAEKEELLQSKQKEIEIMKDKVLRSFAEMENVMDRTKRDAESSKKFAIQSFAKGLLDVADNLGRASAVVKEGFSKIDTSKETSGAVPLLKTLLEGVEMTDKQLAEVFRKFGVEKYDPTNEQFDPNRHNAAFQVPDPSKAPNTVAVVLKSGYMLHDRVLRPAEVGVTLATDNNESAE